MRVRQLLASVVLAGALGTACGGSSPGEPAVTAAEDVEDLAAANADLARSLLPTVADLPQGWLVDSATADDVVFEDTLRACIDPPSDPTAGETESPLFSRGEQRLIVRVAVASTTAIAEQLAALVGSDEFARCYEEASLEQLRRVGGDQLTNLQSSSRPLVVPNYGEFTSAFRTTLRAQQGQTPAAAFVDHITVLAGRAVVRFEFQSAGAPFADDWAPYVETVTSELS